MPNLIDLTGLRVRKLVVIRREPSPRHNTMWWVRCDCGVEKAMSRCTLRHPLTVSCGCHRHSITFRHGKTGTPTHNSWKAMRDRCERPGTNGYERYGGRGITVCERWRLFENFLADMGERPAGTTLDRIENSHGYGPGNCRWATALEQQNNRRVCRRLKLGNDDLTIAQWSRRLGLKQVTLSSRLKRGWSVERTLTEELRA